MFTTHTETGETLGRNSRLVTGNLATFNVELVTLSSHGRGGTESAFGQEERKFGLRMLGRVGRTVFVEVAGGSENVEGFLVSLGEALLALEDALVNGDDRRVVLAGVVDGLGVAERSVGVEQVVGTGGESNPLGVGLERTHLDAKAEPSVLNLGGHAAGPLVESLPSTLDAANNTLLKVGGVLLHDNDGFLKSVLLVDLTLELTEDLLVGSVRVFAGSDAHGGVLEEGDGTGELGDHLGGHLTLLGDRVGELASVLLNIPDVCLDLGAELLEVLYDGALDGLGKVGVVVSNDTGLVTDAVVDVLDTVFTEELVALAEGDLDDTAELGELLGGVVLDVGNTLKVADKLLGDVLPACERNKERSVLGQSDVLIQELQSVFAAISTQKLFLERMAVCEMRRR